MREEIPVEKMDNWGTGGNEDPIRDKPGSCGGVEEDGGE